MCVGYSLSPVFSPLSSPCPGSLVQAALTQLASKSVNPGDTVQITCSGSSYSYGWFQQKTPGTGPVTVIYRDTNRPSGIPSRFSASTSGSTGTLTITGVQAEDEAVYYCGSNNGSSGAGLVTQGDVEVRERGELKMKVFCPSPSWLQPRSLLFQWWCFLSQFLGRSVWVFSPFSSPSPGSLVQAVLTQLASKMANPRDTVVVGLRGKVLVAGGIGVASVRRI